MLNVGKVTAVIFGNIHYKEHSTELSGKLKECIDYAHTHPLAQLEPGSYPIHGDDLFVNIVTYETTEAENRFWEAHRTYLDLHLMLDGEERIDLNFLDNMEIKPYVAKDDFVPAAGIKKCSVVLTVGDFLVCFPEDAHMTGIHNGQPGTIKKAIFKIRI